MAIKMEENFDEQKKLFFSEDGNFETYLDSLGNKKYVLKNEKVRKLCIETFLAFYSFEIGNPFRKEEFLNIKFLGDEELYDAMIDPTKFSEKIKWIKYSEYFENNRDEILLLKDNDENPQFTTALIQIYKEENKEDMLYELAFRFKSFELYAEIQLPWIVKNSEGIGKVTYLSRLQKETFFEGGLKAQFYIHQDKIEPLIVDERKANILSEITQKVLEDIPSIDGGEVLILKFTNGDKDIISAHAGTIRYKYFEKVKIETLSTELFYNKLKETIRPVLLIVYKPNSEDILYYGINSV